MRDVLYAAFMAGVAQGGDEGTFYDGGIGPRQTEAQAFDEFLADMTRQRDTTLAMCEVIQDKRSELLDEVVEARHQRDHARKQALDEALIAVLEVAARGDIPGGCLIPDTFEAGLEAAHAAIRALAEGAKP